MSGTNSNERVQVTAKGDLLGVSVQIGAVVVSVAGLQTREASNPSDGQLRNTTLRLALRALEVAQQELRQEQQ